MIRKIIPSSIKGTVELSGSKYVANRLLPMAALANGESTLKNVVDNNDIQMAIKGLTTLGYLIEQYDDCIKVSPKSQPLDKAVTINTGHSGTFSRFVTAIAALEKHPITIECSEKMATRPMDELFDALKELGVTIDSANQCLPATITGGIKQDNCHLDVSRSSQYLSALLMIAPRLKRGLTIKIASDIVSRAYIDMTVELMNKLGINVHFKDNTFIVPGEQSYNGINYHIPCDPVSSSYFMAAAAIGNSQVTIKNFDFSSPQGEAQFYQVLNKMGINTTKQENDLVIIGTDNIKAINVDMGNMPDAVQTLAVIACFAEGNTHITNIEHLAYKESNRIEDTTTELRKIGIKVKTTKDSMIIYGVGSQLNLLNGASLNTHDDHRMAMSLGLLGIKVPNINIVDAEVVGKSFPDYWDKMQSIGLQTEIVNSIE